MFAKWTGCLTTRTHVSIWICWASNAPHFYFALIRLIVPSRRRPRKMFLFFPFNLSIIAMNVVLKSISVHSIACRTLIHDESHQPNVLFDRKVSAHRHEKMHQQAQVFSFCVWRWYGLPATLPYTFASLVYEQLHYADNLCSSNFVRD